MSAPFNVAAVRRPGRSVFDLSHEVKLTCDMGELIPVMCEEVVPGDTFQIAAEVVVRFQPLVAPILHNVNCMIHYYFVPYRLLWSDWEKFITGDRLGDNASVLPLWAPTDGVTNIAGTLWDYLGMPIGILPDVNHQPLAFPMRAYNLVYNEYYRDQTQIAPISLDSQVIQKRGWEKDYFTSALPFQQRGTAPALPVSGTTSAVWAADFAVHWPAGTDFNPSTDGAGAVKDTDSVGQAAANVLVPKTNLDANTIDLSTATTFDISDFRLATAVQRWLERQARGGARYVETLAAHFGVSPRDERLQRPEYIGGIRSPVIVSEVLQTGGTPAAGAVETDTPQGTMAGHALVADRGNVASYSAQEHGVIIGILSVMPRPAYQQGINRQWLRRSKYDFFWPEFANLSEQPIVLAEIWTTEVDGTAAGQNGHVWGYIGRYDEMRFKQDRVCAGMRDTFDYWHLGRQFAGEPELNQTFIECNGADASLKRIFAVQDEDGLIVNVRNVIRAVRPLPIAAEPSLR